MANNPIEFGTSGWRAVIADRFTFSNVRLVSAAIAHHLMASSGHPHVVVGYDTRFLSDRFAETAAETLSSEIEQRPPREARSGSARARLA